MALLRGGKRTNTPSQRIKQTPPSKAAFSHGLTISDPTNLPVPNQATMAKEYDRRSNASIYKQVAGTKAKKILTGNAKRSSFIFQNRSTTTAVYVSFGQNPTAPDYFDALIIPAGGSLVFEKNAPIDDVYAVTISGTATISVFEGVFL